MMQERTKKKLYIALGVILIAGAIHFFLLPSNLSLGGATGLAISLKQFLPFSMGPLLILVNIILFAIGFLALGRTFGTLTVIASLALSGLVWIFELIIPVTAPLVDSTWLNLVCAVFLYGAGVGIVLNQGASTGGSDIIAKIINKHTGLDLGKACLVTDFVIILLSASFYDLSTILYCLVGVMLNGTLVDLTIDGMNGGKYCIIHTKDPIDISNYLIDIGRSATIYKAVGAYEKQEQMVLTTVLRPRDFIRLKNYLQEKDPKAFMIVTSAHSIFGWRWKNWKE